MHTFNNTQSNTATRCVHEHANRRRHAVSDINGTVTHNGDLVQEGRKQHSEPALWQDLLLTWSVCVASVKVCENPGHIGGCYWQEAQWQLNLRSTHQKQPDK